MVNHGLDVRGATVRYGDTVAVDRVSLQVAPGEVVALLGASGSGKSSLLRAIAGLEPLAAGSLSWDGVDLAGVPVHRRGFVMMLQDGQLFPHLSVAGNVAYGVRHKKGTVPLSCRARKWNRPRHESGTVPGTKVEPSPEELLELVGLAGYGPRPITALSGGEAQRVALARSLAAEPKLLLLDEPLSALDRGLREHLVGVLDASLRATGTPAVYVTHDQDEAFALADRIGVLEGGRLLQLDTPAQLWRHPANEQVARFLGYGPVLSPGQATGLGWPGTPEGRVAVGPDGLVADAGGIEVRVVGSRPQRGSTELSVELPDGQRCPVRIPDIATHGAPPADLAVRLNPDGCALLA